MPADGEQDAPSRFRRALGLEVRPPSGESVVNLDVGGCLAGHVGYPSYPVQTWRSPGMLILLEGRTYGRSDDELGRELGEVFAEALAGGSDFENIARFVRSTDGDFLAVGISASGDRMVAFTDALGRLPVYVHVGAAGVILSRECKVIGSINATWQFDRLGLAEHFWVGYPLGDRTQFEGIRRAGEGFCLEADRTPISIATRQASTYSYRCDLKLDRRDIGASAADLADRLAAAAVARSAGPEGTTTVVSLSGGSDSRTLLAGLRGSRSNVVAATFQRNDGGQAEDVRVAELVAQSLGVPWHLLKLPPVEPEAEQDLAWLRDGLNSVEMAFLLPFFEETVRRWGDSAILLTGDGGDKVFPDLRPVRRPRNIDDLIDTILADAMLMSTRSVEVLLGLEAGRLRDELSGLLNSYPEEALEYNAVRFLIAERGRKALFEGEDRGRSFLWQATPFYALPVFEAGLAVPDEKKADDRFYLEVQRHLDPTLLTLPHADFGIPIDSARFRRRAFARRWTLRAAGPVVRPLLRRVRAREPDPVGPRALTLDLLRQALAAQSPLAGMLDASVAIATVTGATSARLTDWRTVLLVDQLWRSRVTGG